MVVAGVDGVRDAWVIALVEGTGPRTGPSVGEVTWARRADARAVLEATTGCAAVAVDVPLALPVDGYRACERRARERLGAARSSIFYTPVRAVLDCADHRQACTVSRAATGKAISLQAWGIVPKIRDWDAAAPGPHVVEAHPELSFRAMAPDLAFAGKKTTRGAARRMAALGRWLDVPEALAGVPDGVPLEDALDALACAWTAQRFARCEHEPLGDEVDPVSGRPASIVV